MSGDPLLTFELTNVTTMLAEDADTSSAIKVADIALIDPEAEEGDASGRTFVFYLIGNDAPLFDLDYRPGDSTDSIGEVFLKAGAALDFETEPRLDVTVVLQFVHDGGIREEQKELELPRFRGFQLPTSTAEGLKGTQFVA